MGAAGGNGVVGLTGLAGRIIAPASIGLTGFGAIRGGD